MVFGYDQGFAYLLADFLSLITISSCLILKVPQIQTLYSLKTAKGINIYSLLLELTSYTIMLCYNFCNQYAILSYMEYPIILAQELVLIFCVLYYSDNINTKSMIISGVYFGISFGFISSIIPKEILSFLVPFCTPIGAFSKVVQLYEIVSKKDARSVSLLTWFISAFTNFTRIYTVFMDSADVTLLINFSVSTFLSSSILIAAYHYKKPQAAKLD